MIDNIKAFFADLKEKVDRQPNTAGKVKVVAWILVIYMALQWLGIVWFYAAVPFRAYARNVVHNYILQRRKPLKRLWERRPERVAVGWKLYGKKELQLFNGDYHHGIVEYRNVSTLKFWLVVIFIYGWLDDDANEDTTDLGYIQTLVNKQRYQIGSRLLRRWLKKVPRREQHAMGPVLYGNAFDLGDWRNTDPYFNLIAAFFWNNRNKAMNFKYLMLDY